MTPASGNSTPVEPWLAALPKAELHVHLEGSIEPSTIVELAARHGVSLPIEEAAAHYVPGDFSTFIDSFKWVTSFLREPADYALAARRLAESLRRQKVLYAEVTLSIGVMIRREQDVESNFAALRQGSSEIHDVRFGWVFDAVRQWGPDAAMEVARLAAMLRSPDLVAFGMGGDELSLPARDFSRVYEYVAEQGLHRLVHAGETGGADSVREAVEILHVERIGHGIGVMRDERTMDFLSARNIPLEICPTSNLWTGALARQLGLGGAGYGQHPLASLFRRGLPVTLSTDDPAMFETTLVREYQHAHRMGLAPAELLQLAQAGFQHAFLPDSERRAMLDAFRSGPAPPGLV